MEEKSKKLSLRYGLVAYSFNLLFLGIFLVVYAITSGEGLRSFTSSPLPFLALFLLPLISFLFGYRWGKSKEEAEGYRRKASERELELVATQEAYRYEVAQGEELRKLVSVSLREIKHPLTSIIGYATTMNAYWDDLDEDERREYTRFISVSASRMDGIHNNIYRLLNLRVQEPQAGLSLVNAEDLVGEVVELLKGFYSEKGVSVIQRFDRRFPLVEAEPSRLFDVFYNILDLLLRHAQENSIVSIWGNIHDNEAVLRLRGSGLDYPPEQIKSLAKWKMGDPLEMEDDFSSMVLSVYLSRMLLEAQGGRLWVEGSAGGGMSIYVALRARGEKGARGRG